MTLFHRHKAVKVLRVWHGVDLFGNRGTKVTYLCECGKPFKRQVWGHFEKAELETAPVPNPEESRIIRTRGATWINRES